MKSQRDGIQTGPPGINKKKNKPVGNCTARKLLLLPPSGRQEQEAVIATVDSRNTRLSCDLNIRKLLE